MRATSLKPRSATPRLEALETRDVPSSFGRNLISNGHAEAGAASPGGYDVIRRVPGWSPAGDFTVVRYGAAGFPTGLTNGGRSFFAGGPNNAQSFARQYIPLQAADRAAVDSGGVEFRLSGSLGGFSGQGDHAVLTATFVGLRGQTLGQSRIGPVTTQERGGTTGLLNRASAGFLPVGTRSVRVELAMTRQDGSYNDGYADNLSLVLSRTARSVIHFEAAEWVVAEHAGQATVLVRREGYVGGPASVRVTTSDGTATAPSDYAAVDRTLNFRAGQRVAAVTVPVRDNPAAEADETVLLSLGRPGGSARLGGPREATLTIRDDDASELYVASSVTHEIRVYDSETLAYRRSITHPLFSESYSPRGMAFNPRGNLVVATNAYLIEFDASGRERARYPKAFSEPSEFLVFDRAGNLYTTTQTFGSNRLIQYRAADYAYAQTIALPPSAGWLTGVTFDAAGRLYVASQADRRIYVLDGGREFHSFQVVRSFPAPSVGFGPEGLQFNRRGELLVASGDVFRLDPATGQVLGSFDSPDDAAPVPLGADGLDRLFVADWEDGWGTASADLYRFSPDGSSYLKVNDPGLFGPYGVIVSG